ncbi:unnamed protein product [Trichogramma brassicae]|uniref:Uncharacterized protein n=1 Tax=Trichogramma brassicae TaxID=86971 RepID=A0A6H5I9D1_9HYME|nr:unnamed protein product [Trichogramma brassicae]
MLVAAFISGSTGRYDAKFVAELESEADKYSKRYKPTTKFPKDFFKERRSRFVFIGNTGPEMLQFIFYALQKLKPVKNGTTITGWVPEDRQYTGNIIRNTGIQYDAEYRVHELMQRLAAYVHFKVTDEYPRPTEINPCEYFTKDRKVVKCIFWDEFQPVVSSTTKTKPKSDPKERVKLFDAQTQTDKVSPMELAAIRAHVTATEAVTQHQLVIEPNHFSIRYNPFIISTCRLETLQRRREQIRSAKEKINETVEKLMASFVLLDEEEERLKVNLAEINDEIERENFEKEEARRIVEEKVRADKLLARQKNEALARKAEEEAATARKRQAAIAFVTKPPNVRHKDVVEQQPDEPIMNVHKQQPTGPPKEMTGLIVGAEAEAVMQAAVNCWKYQKILWSSKIRGPGYNRPYKVYRKNAIRQLQKASLSKIMSYGIDNVEALKLKKEVKNTKT